MVINNRPVSDNILRIISERGYKQSAVARKAGYSRQTFGYMVHNTRIIRPEDVQRIAFALGVEPGELFKDADLGRITAETALRGCLPGMAARY